LVAPRLITRTLSRTAAGAALLYSARVMDAFKEYPRAASPNEPDSLANLRG
jgi:hypothetical protein